MLSSPRVLVAHPSPDLYGSDKQLLESVEGLLADGARVTVALPGPGPLVPLLQAAGARCVVVRFPVLRKALLGPVGVVRLVAAGVRSLPAAVRLARAHDVLYVNTVTVPVWLVAARVTRTPALCHVHEAEEGAARGLRLAVTAPLLLADRVVVNSDAARRFVLAGVARLAPRVRVVYNGVAGPPEPRAARRVLDGSVRLLLVGRLSPRKGTDVAVAAARLLRERGHDVRLGLVGAVFPGYEWFEERLRRDAGDDGLVDFEGFRADVWPLLDSADIVLVPSRSEPFGNVAVEAMLAGRPVVASAVQGLTEILEPGVTGVLVPADDPGALADGVESLLAAWPAALESAHRARLRAQARFARERYRRDVVGEVRALVAPPAHPNG